MIAEVAPCCICRAKDHCNDRFYLHDNDGNYIFDDDVPVYDPTFPGCEQIIEDYLTEEIS